MPLKINHLVHCLFFLVSLYSFILADIIQGQDIQLEQIVGIKDSEELFIPGVRNATMTWEGNILLIPSQLTEVYLFDERGDYLTSFGQEGRGPGEFLSPIEIAADKSGNVYIYDQKNRRVSVWNQKFEYVTDINFKGGWNTHFKTHGDRVFIWASPDGIQANGRMANIIYEVLKAPWRIEPVHFFEYDDWKVGHPFIDAWSKWDWSKQGEIIITGKTDEFDIYRMNREWEVALHFGREYNVVKRSEAERETKINAARKNSPTAAAILERGLPDEKPPIIELSVDGKNRVWVHRNKEFGAREELDVYSIDGEYLAMVILPASKDEYRMLGIFDERILFKVITSNGLEELRIYSISDFD